MLACGTIELPISKGDKLSKKQCPKNDLERDAMKDKPYASLVGSLMYAQVCTRPDLAFTISVLGRFQSNARKAHWNAGMRVLRYLQKTKSHMLVYRKTDHLVLEGYSDSDFAGGPNDLKSTSRYVFMMVVEVVSWSVKQDTVASTTMVAKYLSCCEVVNQAVWLKNFITGLHVVDSISRPMQFYCDNNAAIFFTKNNKRSNATRNLDIKFLVAHGKVMEGLVKIDYLETSLMIAGPLNKVVPAVVFKKHVKKMGVLADFDVEE
ncbi:secreted RxLR effector protein 161-like [Malus domestica]|uniref:secreted RxLR effector protein 161-like n=1 Tax=Malus domestica TaxID=3750 RepID=UPI003975AEE2